MAWAGNETSRVVEPYKGQRGAIHPGPNDPRGESTMLELIALGAAGAAGFFGHLKSRDFVRRRLRYTRFVDQPGMGIVAGVAAALVAAPLVAVLPVVGAGTAVVFGAGVGTGVALGARDAKRPLIED